MTVTGVEYSRLSKQWNREFLVEKFGVYTYQLNDLFKSLDAKFNTLFGYDNAAKDFREFYSNKEEHKTNEYTDKFKGKNVIVIHTESMQNAALNTSFNGQEVTPNLNRLKMKECTLVIIIHKLVVGQVVIQNLRLQLHYYQ